MHTTKHIYTKAVYYLRINETIIALLRKSYDLDPLCRRIPCTEEKIINEGVLFGVNALLFC